MMYLFRHWDGREAGYSPDFCIDLPPNWIYMVAMSGINQEKINMAMGDMSPEWIRMCGIRWPDATDDISVTWGKWGPERIAVTNWIGCDAGLVSRIDRFSLELDQWSPRCLFYGGRTLIPVGVMSRREQMLLVTVFTWISERIVLGAKHK